MSSSFTDLEARFYLDMSWILISITFLGYILVQYVVNTGKYLQIIQTYLSLSKLNLSHLNLTFRPNLTF